MPVDETNDESASAGEFFDRYASTWDEYYTDPSASGHAYDYLNRRAVLLSLVDARLEKGARILEFGCGAGHTAVELIRRGFEVTCLDVSAEMIAATNATLSSANLKADCHVGVLDDDAMAAAAPFDAVIGMGVMEYVPSQRDTLTRIRELLSPGGQCFLSFPNASSPVRVAEHAVKRAVAYPLGAISGSQRMQDIARRPSNLLRPSEVASDMQAAGLEPLQTQYFSFGARVRGYWIPPLPITRRIEGGMSKSRLSWFGRNWITVAQRPN